MSNKHVLNFMVLSLIFGGLTYIYGLNYAIAAEGPNIIPNPSLESQSGANPTSWARGRWGTNTAVFKYPVSGINGARAVEVELTQRTSGDAKWYFAEVPVEAGATYTFSDQYQSDVSSFVTIQYKLSNGSLSWLDIGSPGPASSWSTFQKTFTVPSNATHLTIFHLINQVGFLRTDNYSLRKQDLPSNTFSEGFVSLNFDDGWKTTYQNAIPILQAKGFKTTQYIISGRFSFPAYVNQNEALDMYNKGHEIGAHTRTHRDLVTLSDPEKQSEIAGSRQDLLNLGISPVNTFAYPFGSYNAPTDAIVKQSGYIGARTSDGGFNAKTGNKYLLKRQPVELNTTFAQVKSWVDQAQAQKLWLVLVFHRVDSSQTQYSITPQLFQQIVDYLATNNVPVRTTREGINLMSQ